MQNNQSEDSSLISQNNSIRPVRSPSMVGIGSTVILEEEIFDENDQPVHASSPKIHGNNSMNRKSNKTFLGMITFFAAIGGFLFGYDTGVVSGVILLLSKFKKKCRDFFFFFSLM